MANKRNLKEHFEAIRGQEIDVETEDVALREYISLYSRADGWRTSREIGTTGESTKACGETVLFTVGGLTRTKANGKVEFLLSDFHCGTIRAGHPIIFVASARQRSPAFVTTFAQLAAGGDVKLEILAWDANGAPAANVGVSWFCQVPNLNAGGVD
jgi:hypothetical protein